MTNASAKSLLTTILGGFVLPHGESAWTSTLVRALGTLDVKERNARQAIARLGDQGIIAVERHGRLARWHLTAPGRALLKTGAERIYRFGARSQAWDGRWLTVLCAIPEAERSKRQRFRTQLAFEGFGFITSGVAISPHLDREAEANAIVVGLGLARDATVLRSEAGTLSPDSDLLAQAWDLTMLADEYVAFAADHASMRPLSQPEAFAATVRLVHAWRRFPFIDPEIPIQLLPADWPGTEARQLFERLRTSWAADALGWYTGAESVTR